MKRFGQETMITFIIVVLDFCVTGSIIYMLYHDYRLKKSGSTEKPLKKKWQYWLSIFALFCVIGVTASFDNTDTTAQNENSSDTAQSKRKKKRQKVTDKKAAQTANDDDSEDGNGEIDSKEANTNIAMLLKDDQKDATKGKEKYAYALYLKNIKYNKDSVEVQVTNDFFNLINDEKDIVAERVQGVVGAGISMTDSNYEPKDDQEGYYLSFYYGKIAVGHSKMSDSHEYKWYKSANK